MTEHRVCPDGGACHHGCDVGCWRVNSAEPLSGVYPDDDWPASVLDGPSTLPPSLLPPEAEAVEPPPEPALFAKLRAVRARAQAKDGHGMVQLLMRPEEALALARAVLPTPQMPDRFADLAPSRIASEP